MLLAIRRASSSVSSLAAERRPRLSVVVADNKAGGLFLDRPRRREAMAGAALAVLAVLGTAVMVASGPP
jgi:hypothetical protein